MKPLPPKLKLKVHKDAIDALRTRGFGVEPLRFSKGDHLVVRVTREGRAGQITISGSPTGLAHHSLATAAKRATA